MAEKLATEQEVAEYLGINYKALTERRYRGVAPPHIRMGPRTIRYRWSDVEQWLEDCTNQAA